MPKRRQHMSNTRHPANMTAREAAILRLVVKSFIETAGPVASRFLSLRYDLGLSPASIRSTMHSLESKGYLRHPHTSSGRIPTDRGYRTYVDSLMERATLRPDERRLMRLQLTALQKDTNALVEESSRVLASLAGLLGVALTPQLRSGILQRLEIVPVASDRVMFVISVLGGVIRTIVFNLAVSLERHHLDELVALLNERLSGLTLDEIRRTCCDRVEDLSHERTGIVQLILNDTDSLFSDAGSGENLRVDGTANMLAQPEFADTEQMRSIISLVDDSPSLATLVAGDGTPEKGRPTKAVVAIGEETGSEAVSAGKVRNLSIVTSRYQRSNMQGTIGVIGPTRMDYARVIALVEGMAALMSWPGGHPGTRSTPGIMA